MLLLLSPSKTLDYESKLPALTCTNPELLDDSKKLIKELRKLSKSQLAKLMGISEKLSDLNYQRYQEFKTPFTKQNARPALLAFKGDVYQDIDVANYSKRDFEFAQKHLRILSGLYGVLKPLDLMQPYRLEMGTNLNNPHGKDLYAFWNGHITEALEKALKKQGDNIIVNLASNEYAKSAHLSSINAEVITPVFKEKKNGKYKVIALFAKRARGAMANYIIKNKITKPADLKKFKADGYRYNATESNGDKVVFARG